MAHRGHGEKGLRKPDTPSHFRYGNGPAPCTRDAYTLEHRERRYWDEFIRNGYWIDEYDYRPPGYIMEDGGNDE